MNTEKHTTAIFAVAINALPRVAPWIVIAITCGGLIEWYVMRDLLVQEQLPLSETFLLFSLLLLILASWSITILRQQRLLLAQVEQALSEVHSYRTALDEHVLVATTDPQGRILEANTLFSKMSGYSREELIGNTHALINSGYHPKTFFADLWKTISTGATWKGEICNRAKDGHFFWVDTTIVPKITPQGTIEKYIAVRTDISERKNYEQVLQIAKEQAEAATRTKSQFLANVSHEVRTPLTSIIGFTEEALQGALSPQEQRDQLKAVLRNARHLLRIINEILDISKVEAGKLEVEIVEVSLFDILEEVSLIMSPRAAQKKIGFVINHTLPLPAVIYTDPTRLKQIIFNLIENAIKFTERGGVSVSVSCDFAREKLLISIKDSGIGITDEQRTKIFSSFSQADASISRRFGGTGLGLFISRQLAMKLGGNIQLDSIPHQGSTFTIEIATGSLEHVDRLATIPEVVREEDYTAPIEGYYEGEVLLAEDMPDTQKLLSSILSRYGIKVTVASDGCEAVALALQTPYDLILMDMQMPKIDGLTATRQLREEGYRGPIIALTAHMIGGHLEECIAAGCEGCLGKPFERKALVRILSLFLMKGDAPKSLTGSPFAANANEFKRNFDGNLDALEATRAQGDLASLKILAHRLAGAAAFAYREIYDSLAALETAAQEQRCEDCELLITSLKDIHRTKGARYSAERRGPYIAP